MPDIKLLLKLSPLILVMIIFAGTTYHFYEKSKRAEQEKQELVNKLKQFQAFYKKSNEVVAEREQNKIAARIKTNQVKTEISNATKDNECANQPIPADIINWMRSN